MLNIHAIPAFSDNYLWLFHNEGSRDAFVVDPGDAEVIEAALQKLDLDLAGILLTHHHWDHTGGVEALSKSRNIPIYGPASPNIPQVTHTLREGDLLKLGPNTQFKVLEVAGHTLDHIAYHDPDNETLFCGDTLFAGGCGRMFEGNPEQMQSSLAKLAKLPPNTKVYCAHEYTQSNLAFAHAVEPENAQLNLRVKNVASARQANQRTVPSTIADELETNPFLRWDSSAVIESAQKQAGRPLTSPADIFAALRGWKDNF